MQIDKDVLKVVETNGISEAKSPEHFNYVVDYVRDLCDSTAAISAIGLTPYKGSNGIVYIDNVDLLERSLWVTTFENFESCSGQDIGIIPKSKDAIVVLDVDYRSTNLRLVIDEPELSTVKDINSDAMKQIKECIIAYFESYMEELVGDITDSIKGY